MHHSLIIVFRCVQLIRKSGTAGMKHVFFFQVIAFPLPIERNGSRFQSADGILRAPPELLRAAGEPRDDAAAPAPRPAPGGEPVEERGHAARLALRVRLSPA